MLAGGVKLAGLVKLSGGARLAVLAVLAAGARPARGASRRSRPAAVLGEPRSCMLLEAYGIPWPYACGKAALLALLHNPNISPPGGAAFLPDPWAKASWGSGTDSVQSSESSESAPRARVACSCCGLASPGPGLFQPAQAGQAAGCEARPRASVLPSERRARVLPRRRCRRRRLHSCRWRRWRGRLGAPRILRSRHTQGPYTPSPNTPSPNTPSSPLGSHSLRSLQSWHSLCFPADPDPPLPASPGQLRQLGCRIGAQAQPLGRLRR